MKIFEKKLEKYIDQEFSENFDQFFNFTECRPMKKVNLSSFASS